MVQLQYIKDTMLGNAVYAEIERCQICLDCERRDLAQRHLQCCWEFCDEFDASQKLRNEVQDLEDEFHHRDHSASKIPLRRPGRTWPRVPVDPQSPQLVSASPPISDDSRLFLKLMSEVQRVPSASGVEQSNDASGTPERTVADEAPELEHGPVRTNTLESTASFVGIEKLLPQLRQAADRAVESTETQQDQTRARVMEKVVDWQSQHLPQDPKAFKGSEEPSPRRHSFPVASPTSPSSPISGHTRKRSVHTPPQPIATAFPEPSSPTSSTQSHESASDYSRRRSHDETSTVLSDTPSLLKLAGQIHTNPFGETSSSPVVERVRRLSVDSPALAPLDTSPSPTHDPSEPTSPSPLRESFNADEVKALAGSSEADSDPNDGQFIPSLQPHRRPSMSSPSTNSKTVPSQPSPLRESFSFPVQPLNLARRTPTSRLPQPRENASATTLGHRPPVRSTNLPLRAQSVKKTRDKFQSRDSDASVQSQTRHSQSTQPAAAGSTLSPATSRVLAMATARPDRVNLPPAISGTALRRTQSTKVSSLATRFEGPAHKAQKSSLSSVNTQSAFEKGFGKAQALVKKAAADPKRREVPIGQRPPWQMPGRRVVPVPEKGWIGYGEGRPGSAGSSKESENGTRGVGKGTENGREKGKGKGFVRFGNEMGRGAGVDH